MEDDRKESGNSECDKRKYEEHQGWSVGWDKGKAGRVPLASNRYARQNVEHRNFNRLDPVEGEVGGKIGVENETSECAGACGER